MEELDRDGSTDRSKEGGEEKVPLSRCRWRKTKRKTEKQFVSQMTEV